MTRAQAEFKETYYGYPGAVAMWQALQDYGGPPRKLAGFLDWVPDETFVSDVERLRWTPIARPDPVTGRWRFRSPDEVEEEHGRMRNGLAKSDRIRVLVDAVYFQHMRSGIGRMRLSLLDEWKKTGFIENVVVLDRGGTCPRVEGVSYRSIRLHQISPVGDDAEYLQRICDEEDADLLVSTYYTTPTRTPTIFMGYDMIPEVIGIGLDDLWWQQKRRAIQYAAGHVMISQNSARDLVNFFPGVPLPGVLIAYCSVEPQFTPASDEEIRAFRQAHGIEGPYVLMVGERRGWQGYKNGILAFAGVAHLPPGDRPVVVCVGGPEEIEDEYRQLLPEGGIRRLKLGDSELRVAYSGAHALIYPSLYEGFGIPVAEAIACGCPVITCANSSLPEVGGEGAIYVPSNGAREVAEAILKLRDPAFRAERIEVGLRHIARFDAARSAKLIADLYLDKAAQARDGRLHNPAVGLRDAFRLARQNADLTQASQQAQQAAFEVKNAAAERDREHRQALEEMRQRLDELTRAVEAERGREGAAGASLAEREREHHERREALQRRIDELANELDTERHNLTRLEAMQQSPFWKARQLTVSTLRTLRLRQRG